MTIVAANLSLTQPFRSLRHNRGMAPVSAPQHQHHQPPPAPYGGYSPSPDISVSAGNKGHGSSSSTGGPQSAPVEAILKKLRPLLALLSKIPEPPEKLLAPQVLFGVYLAILFSATLVFSSYDFSLTLTFSSLTRMYAFILLLLTLSRTAPQISLKTLQLYGLVFFFR